MLLYDRHSPGANKMLESGKAEVNAEMERLRLELGKVKEAASAAFARSGKANEMAGQLGQK